MSQSDTELNLILDKFSKAHPFADTRAYNVYHEEAIQALNRWRDTAVVAELEHIFVDAEIDDDKPTSDMKAHLVYEHLSKRIQAIKARNGEQQ